MGIDHHPGNLIGVPKNDICSFSADTAQGNQGIQIVGDRSLVPGQNLIGALNEIFCLITKKTG